MTKHLTTLPFSGFYYSLHDSALDGALNQIFADRSTGCTVNQDLVQRACDRMDWRAVHTTYAKEYCENFSHEFVPVEFDELSSPREYNFTTDRIFAYISTETLRLVFLSVDTEHLRRKIRENHTSRSGFCSFYANTLEAWPEDVTEWDHNQIGTLMQAFVGDDFDQYREDALMEDSRCNGFLDEVLFKHGPNMERLAKVHEYLDETRPAREELTA